MAWYADPQIWISLVTLTVLEIVLGIDNIVFITILADKLPENQREKAREVGLALAMGMRILLLFSLSWLIGLTKPLFSLFSHAFSTRDIIMMVGGIFLLGKSTVEIHNKLEGIEGQKSSKVKDAFSSIVIQIMLLDIVFSLDSVITAIGMSNLLGVMIAAVVIAVGIMMISINGISNFVNQHPTIKILALSFLLMIGVSLVAEGLSFHIPKGYIYFAMGFSIFVEFLNMKMLQHDTEPVNLREAYTINKKE